MASSGGDLCLGIDIGTTSVKLSLIGQDDTQAHEQILKSSDSVMPSISAPKSGSEQNIWLLFQTIQESVNKLDALKLKCVTKIAVTGQMHGCVLWKAKSVRITEGKLTVSSNDVSPLFNWQDGRCSSDFLATLPKPKSHLRIATGHGCATLFWWSRNYPGYLEQFDYAGTVMDLFVSALCGQDEPVMSVQNAASWGYFDCESSTWNKEILSEAGFPIRFLPKVKESGSLAGSLQSFWLDLQSGTKVSVAMGDLACSVYSVLQTPSDAVMNVGTSAQLVRGMPDGFVPPMDSHTSPVEYFPYFDNRYLAVAAALNGGNALSTFVDMLMQWFSPLSTGVIPTKDEVYKKLTNLANKAETDLVVDPVFLGERHRQDDRASIFNIRPDNADLGGLFRAFCRGIIQNMASMMPREELKSGSVQRIVGCGSALNRNPVLKEELERCFELPVMYREDCDACFGAALYALRADW